MRYLLHALSASVLVALVTAGAAAQVYVPTPNPASGRGNAYPWAWHSEWRYQMIIGPALLGSQPFRITDLAFAPCANGAFSSPQCELRMAHAAQSTLSRTFDVNLAKDRTVVYSGALAWTMTANQWCDLGLAAGFDFNGVDPLVIEIRYTSPVTFNVSCYSDGTTIPRLYIFGSGAYTASTGTSQIDNLAPNLRFTVLTISLTGSGAPRPGGAVDLDLLSVADAGLVYQVGTSLGTGPIPLGSRRIGLSPDDLLVVSTSGLLPTVFVNYAGILDAGGKARARIQIPNNAAFIGIRLHSAFLTLDASAPFGVKSISNTFSFSIQT